MDGLATQLRLNQYYYDRLSMFLKESFGIKERIKFLSDTYNKIDDTFDYIINGFDIFNVVDDYTKDYDDEWYSDTADAFLDKLGAIFDVPRSFSMKYCDITKTTKPASIADLDITKYVTLTNKDYLAYIRLSIIKQHFLGTQEELTELYGDCETEKTGSVYKLLNLNFVYYTSGKGTVDIFFLYNDESQDVSLDIRCMFLNGLLTIESLGIVYTHYIGTKFPFLKFSGKDSTEYQDTLSRFDNLTEDLKPGSNKSLG